MAGVAFAVEGDGVGFATESYAASALYATLASLSGALWRIRRAKYAGLTNRTGFCVASRSVRLSLGNAVIFAVTLWMGVMR
jgi:hypothetical protein